MRRRLSWLLLLLPPLAAQPPDYPGPRVELVGELPLAVALAEIAPQLNRRFEGRVLQDQQAAKPYPFALMDLSELETIAALEELTGQEFRRTSRTVYSVDRPRRGLTPLSRELGRWRIELLWLRWYFSADLFPGDPSRNRQTATLTPQIELRAPDDGAALGLLGITTPMAVTDTGEKLPEGPPTVASTAPEKRQSNAWQISTNLGIPSPAATRLTRLELGLQFATKLAQARFSFDRLSDPSPRRQTQLGYTATLAERAADERLGALNLTLTGPVPAGLPAEQATQILQRETFCEARLSAGGKPLPTEVRLAKSEVKDGVWTSRWSLTVAREPWVTIGPELTELAARRPMTNPPPDRLDLVVLLPSPAGGTVPVVFGDLSLPSREPPLP